MHLVSNPCIIMANNTARQGRVNLFQPNGGLAKGMGAATIPRALSAFAVSFTIDVQSLFLTSRVSSLLFRFYDPIVLQTLLS